MPQSVFHTHTLIPAAVTVVASKRLIPVLAHEVRMASIDPPNSFTRFAICIEKSIPTPTRMDPIITVTRERDTPPLSITSHCIATVKPTGTVVNNAYLMSRKTRASVRIVKPRAKARDVHWESTMSLLTSIVTDATPMSLSPRTSMGLAESPAALAQLFI